MKKYQTILNVMLYIIFIIMWICIAGAGFIIVTFNSDIIIAPISILFILVSIAVIAFPFYIKLSNPKKIIIAIVLTIVVALAGELTFQGMVKYYSVFTPDKWTKNIKARHRMIESLESQYMLEGMTEDEVKEILGEPGAVSDLLVDNENQYYYDYYAGDAFLTTIYYYVTFENGIVVKAWTHHD